ncbi:MAG TPA: SPW repeat protein [Candidatus Chromulinivoraceae bacterium]|nr:SPW repeat protein [Candidatus Chromulinivoraceae bacterium]
MEEQAKSTAKGIRITNLVLGIWLILSPFLFSYTSTAMTNSIILGAIIAILAVIRLSTPSQTWASWLNGIAGLWLIIAPFIIGSTESAVLWNQIIVGLAVAVLGFWSGTMTMPVRMTHHHSA